MSERLGVGSTVWICDGNRRVYRRDAQGRSYGSPIFREHFRPLQIEAATRVSWVLSDGRKVNKKTLAGVFTSQAQIDEACYINDEVSRISRDVMRCGDAATLRQIDALLKAQEK